MMWYPRKIRTSLNLSLHSSVLTCQISGRNFFQVGDDVTTRTFKGPGANGAKTSNMGMTSQLGRMWCQ
ncbi:hypothetical protein HanIR_Chr13g0631451 [Helianthus annuus]|nr:hypothetical protein HanIR_Chr13g0631451 [Helianthus annuus]